jgi:hypothetical protein
MEENINSVWSIQWKHAGETHPRIDACFRTKEEVIEVAAGIAVEHTLSDFQHLSKVHYSFVEELVEAFEKNDLMGLIELWNNILRSSGEPELLIRELKLEPVFSAASKTRTTQRIETLKGKIKKGCGEP